MVPPGPSAKQLSSHDKHAQPSLRSRAPVVAMQCSSQHFTGTGCAAVSQDYDWLLCQLPWLGGEDLSG